MKRKTTADLILMLACMFLLAILLAPTQAKATGKPETVTPAPTTSTSSSTSSAASQAKAAIDLSLTNSATGGAGGLGGAGGNAAGGSVGGDSVTSRAWSLFAQPPAFTPPMAPITGCAPLVTQEATSGWLIVGGLSTASGKTDPTDCTLVALRNAKVDQCQYASAKQIEDLLTAKLLPGFKPSAADGFADLDARACAALKAPPKPEAEVRYVAAFQPPASAPAACEKAPEPAKPKAAKVAKAAPKKVGTCG